MLNQIWLGLILAAVLVGGFSGRVKPVVDGAVHGAETAVTLSIGLIGVMALWLGLMRLADKSGLVHVLSRGLRPVLRRLFPDVPQEHPAMGSIVMNLAANMLGLTNAATPLGLRAMRDLESLNPHPGTATNAMCTFLAINTSSIQLIPMTAVAILASAGSTNPTAIIGTALLATTCSTVVGITAVKWLEHWRMFRIDPDLAAASPTPSAEASAQSQPADASAPPVLKPVTAITWAILIAFAGVFLYFFISAALGKTGAAVPGAPDTALVRSVNAISLLAIPFLVCFFPLYGALRGLPVYEEFVEGAREGFQVAIRIIPFLVAMLVAIGMFRGAGAIDWLTRMLGPVLHTVGFPPELLPISLMRPLSGSASMALFSELVKTHGADHLISRTAATLFGSTETTFYVIAVYFGSVAIRRTRHAVPAGLLADLAGIIASVFICRMIFR